MKKIILFILISVIACVFIVPVNTVESKSLEELDLVENYFVEMNVADYEVREELLIKDFSKNKYYLFEFFPSGYAIFDVNSKEFIEGSFETNSPYYPYNESKKFYYGGPLNYFIKRGNLFYDIYQDDYFMYSFEHAKYAAEFNNSIEMVTSKKAVDNNVIGINGVRDGEWYYINDYNYFRGLNAHPYNEVGTCSFVALSIILGYLDAFKHDGIVADNYIAKKPDGGESPGTKNSLQDVLIGYGHYKDIPLNPSYPATANDLKLTFDDYKNEHIPSDIRNNFNVICESPGVFGTVDKEKVRSLIYNNIPVIIVMRSYSYASKLYPNNAGSGSWHTVVAYGYSGDKFYAHFGWPSASEYIVNSSILQSYISIQFTGEHVHSGNYTKSDGTTRCGCNHICSYTFAISSVSMHKRTCIKCNRYKMEPHRWGYKAGIGSYCLDCGYISRDMPFGILIKKLHKYKLK